MAYAISILHSAQEYGPMEITVTLLHFAQKYKWTNTLESYYIQFFHQHSMISKEQTH